jgi:hypothetical protein
MNGLEERLREAIDSSVADAQPKFDVMAAVRRRHRRRLIRASAASVAAVTAVAVAAVFLGVPHAGSGRFTHAGAAPVFPGGGRLLLADRDGLKWLYPNGRTVRIVPGFDGATISGDELLARRKGAGYYTMKLDGSQQRQVLPAERGNLFADDNAVLSPDGSRLAYIREYAPHGNHTASYTLWVLDLATGHRVSLGPVGLSEPSPFAWRDDTTIVATSADYKSVLLANAVTQRRSTYLTVTDPTLVHRYEQARPGAGPPAYIVSDGWSGTASYLAVQLAAASQGCGPKLPPSLPCPTKPAELALAGRTPVASYAPAAPRPPGWRQAPEELRFTWGPGDLFLLQATVGEGMQFNTYAGTFQSGLSNPVRSDAPASAAFNPAGNVIALQQNGQVTFVSTPHAACERTQRCLAFHEKHLAVDGNLQAWAK